MGYSPWGRKESDTTEQLIQQTCSRIKYKNEKKLKWDRAYDIVSLYEMIYIFHGGHKSITTGPYREAIGECLVITRLRS